MRFLKEPTYNLRDPSVFLESLLQRWTHELLCFTDKTLPKKPGQKREDRAKEIEATLDWVRKKSLKPSDKDMPVGHDDEAAGTNPDEVDDQID